MKKRRNGRPTKYKAEYVEKIIEFFSLKEDSYRENVSNQGTVQMVPRRMPTLERFADEIGVDASTLYRWATATKKGSNNPLHPKFCMAYTRAKNCQMAYILEAGVVGALNPSFLNLFMKNAHGWVDKVEQETTHSGGIDLEEINRDLEKAAVEADLKYQEMLKNGELGNYDT